MQLKYIPKEYVQSIYLQCTASDAEPKCMFMCNNYFQYMNVDNLSWKCLNVTSVMLKSNIIKYITLKL